jgi:hypothetical protein
LLKKIISDPAVVREHRRPSTGPKFPRLQPDRWRALCHIDGRQPLAALVAHVINDALVNLAVLDCNGMFHSRTSIPHEQGGEAKPEHGYFCSWIPYHVGQAAKRRNLSKSPALS